MEPRQKAGSKPTRRSRYAHPDRRGFPESNRPLLQLPNHRRRRRVLGDQKPGDSSGIFRSNYCNSRRNATRKSRWRVLYQLKIGESSTSSINRHTDTDESSQNKQRGSAIFIELRNRIALPRISAPPIPAWNNSPTSQQNHLRRRAPRQTQICKVFVLLVRNAEAIRLRILPD